MMWTELNINYKEKNDRDVNEIRIMSEPKEGFKQVFKYFYEERMWHLAQLMYDPRSFNLFNFNSIVKTTLI